MSGRILGIPFFPVFNRPGGAAVGTTRPKILRPKSANVNDYKALVANDHKLPPRLRHLQSREREVASVIFAHGPLTATELQARLSDPLSNGAVHSMLARLCDKGILKRRERTGSTATGRRAGFVYLPARTDDVLRHQALRQCARDFFGGSILRMARMAVDILEENDRQQNSKAGCNRLSEPSPLRGRD